MIFPKVLPLPTVNLVKMLRDADSRTMDLISGLNEQQLMGPQLDIVNPILWEIGHIAWFYEKFILRDIGGQKPVFDNVDSLYDSMAVPHSTRWDLNLPDLKTTIRYRREILEKVINWLGLNETATSEHTYFTQLTTFHEDMHDEAFTYTRQTLRYPAPCLGVKDAFKSKVAGPFPGDIYIPEGVHMLGSSPKAPFYMDNEKWAHGYEVKPFSISRAPVTNLEFADFVEAGGYEREKLWSKAGWNWRMQNGVKHPLYWIKDSKEWVVENFDQIEVIRPHAPVAHVSWFEADAWCRWAERRLPWEAEWEVAASRTPTIGINKLSGLETRYPWGDKPPNQEYANLDGALGGTVDVAEFSEGESGYGCRQMIGNVWEWTQSSFRPFEGFVADPYSDYSEPWFDGRHAVLRGGSWATRNRTIWNTFRNFYTCDRRDIIAGFRTCALQMPER